MHIIFDKDMNYNMEPRDNNVLVGFKNANPIEEPGWYPNMNKDECLEDDLKAYKGEN